jgi:ketosteroid isomerase-like protein
MDPIDAFYEHYNRGELDAVMGLFTDDAVFVNTVLGQTLHGPSEILGFLEDYADIVEAPTAVPVGSRREDDGVITTAVRLGGRLRHTGITEDVLPSELVHGFRIRDGLIAWYAISSSLPDALRAAGRLD